MAIAAALLFVLLRQKEVSYRLLNSLNHRGTDVMFYLRGARPTTGRVVIVDIDEKSLASKELGQWQWPRDKLARILRNINAAGPKAIGLDIVFAEPDRTSLSRILPDIEKRIGKKLDPEPGDNHDEVLGLAVEETKTVVGYFFAVEKDERKRSSSIAAVTVIPAAKKMPSIQELYPPDLRKYCIDLPGGELAPTGPGMSAEKSIPEAYRAVLNVDDIDLGAETAGFFNAEPDDSGMVRKVPLLYCCLLSEPPLEPGGKELFNPTVGVGLSLAMLKVGADVKEIHYLASRDEGIYALKIGPNEVYVDGQAHIFVNYRGPAGPAEGTFEYVSAIDVYRGQVPREKLSGKYVLVGTSATGLKDLRATPFTSAGPGVEVHANVIDNFLASDALRHDPHLEIMVTLMLVLIGGIALSAILAYAGPLWGGLAGVVFMLLATVGNYYAFFLNNQVIGVTWPLLTVLAIFLTVTLANYFTEGKQKRFLHGAFSTMVSPEVVGEIVKDPGKLSLSGEEKELTVMFADIRNFTGISEKLAPNEICQLLNEFLTEMTEIIQGHHGTVDKFIGDEIMAFWGAPTDDPRHAENAVRAGISMRRGVREFAVEWSKRGLPLFDMGVGLNAGVVRVGNMGSRDRFNYTVIGDNVNLASRLQGLNKAYGTGFIISQSVLDLLPEEFLVRPVDMVRVVGREQPVAIYEPLAVDRSDESAVAAAEAFARALRRYRQRKFTEAREIVAALNAEKAEKLYAVYIERLEALEADPPGADWDGVFVFKTK